MADKPAKPKQAPAKSHTVKAQELYPQDKHGALVGGLMVLSLVCVLLLGGVVYLITHKPEPKYFATTEGKAFVQLRSIAKPYLSTAEVLSWVTQGVVSAYTYNYSNYQSVLNEKVRPYFTASGWKEFTAAFNESGNIGDVVAKKIVVTAIPNKVPVVTREGKILGNRGPYSWRIEIPIRIAYQSSSETKQSTATIRVLVSEVPTTEIPKGIGIVQFQTV